MRRFQRQMLLPEIQEKGQRALMASKALIIGAGGLGHPALQYLAAMGVGQIGIVDGDEVQESNLHRQVLFEYKDIGKNKADCLREKYEIRGDPDQIVSYPSFLCKTSALRIFPEYDLIIDGTDNFETKMLINDVCCFLQKPMIYGAISQYEGQVSVFWKGKGPCYRCLMPSLPKAKIQSCAEAGVVGALPGIIGGMQAFEALKTLLNLKVGNEKLKPLIGRLHFFDFSDNSSRILKIPTRIGCPCRAHSFDLSLTAETERPAPVCEITKFEDFLDVREMNEWEEFHLPGSTHWPLSWIESGSLPENLRNRTLTAICQSGIRAGRAAEILSSHGFEVNYTKRSIYGFENRKQ